MPRFLRRLLLWIATLPVGLRLVLLLAAILHGVPLSWGMPASDSWDVDGVAPRDVIPGLVATFTPGDFYTYPPLQLIILGLLTLPVTIFAVINADTTDVPSVIQEIIKPPYMTAITMTARIVTMLMSLVIIVCVAFIAEEFAPRERKKSVMIFAALFATLNWAFSYYAHTSNLDVPYLFWACLAALWLTRAISRHEPRRLRMFAVFAVFAVATKDQAYAMFLLGAPASLVVWFAIDAWPRSFATRSRVLRDLIVAMVLGVVLILILDGALFNPSGFRARVAFLTGPASKDFEILSRDAHGRFLAFIDSFTYFRRHYPPILCVFVIAGVPISIAGARKQSPQIFAASLIPLCIALSFSICFNVAALRSEERFTLPQMLVGAIYAGSAFDMLFFAPSLHSPIPRLLGRVVGTAGLLLALSECIRLDATLLAEPRYDTEAFLSEHAHAGDTIEVHGLNVYLPRFPTDLAAPHAVRVGKTDPKRRGPIPGMEEVQAPLLDIEERRPRFIVVNDCYVWRYLERDDMASTTGHVVPGAQRVDAADEDSTTFFRRLFHGELHYKLAHESRITSFTRSWMHSSLGCPMFTFERE